MNEERKEEPLVPIAVEPLSNVSRPSDPMVKLDKGTAPLSEVLNSANPHCRACHGKGYQDYRIGAGKPQSRICGCAIRRMNRKLEGDDEITLLGRVEKDPAAERERVQKRLDRMQAEVDAAEAEYAKRICGHDAGIAEAAGEVADVEAELAEGASHLNGARRRLDELRDAVERQLSHVAFAEADVVEATARLGQKKAQRAALQSKSDRVLANAETVLHRIKRLRDRMALSRQQHADVLGKD